MDDASSFLFDVDYEEFSFKVHFPLPKGDMFASLTSKPTFNICVVKASSEKSCIMFRNKTPNNLLQKPDEEVIEVKPPTVYMKPVDSDASLKLIFTQPMNFTRLAEHNISLENMKVVVN